MTDCCSSLSSSPSSEEEGHDDDDDELLVTMLETCIARNAALTDAVLAFQARSHQAEERSRVLEKRIAVMTEMLDDYYKTEQLRIYRVTKRFKKVARGGGNDPCGDDE